MSSLFTFPGQGAQRAGMLHTLPGSPVVQAALDEASAILGLDVRTLDTADWLRSTIAAQTCLLITGVATARHLETLGALPDAVAGFSIGAYAAAVHAAVLSYRDALRLVDHRAHLMASAWPSGHGMTAIRGLTRPALETLIARIHTTTTPVHLANVNAPRQLVIAGADDAMNRVAALALAHGAHDAQRLAVAVPSHCALLADAAREMQAAFADVPVSPPRLAYYSASAARPLRDPKAIAADLASNMARPVLWHDTIALAAERGTRLLVEMPPGHVLTRLAEAASPDVLAIAADETRGDSIAARVQQERLRRD